MCRAQNLINKKNFSRQSNNKFRDRPHMIQAEFENCIEDENNFQIQEIDWEKFFFRVEKFFAPSKS